MNVFSIRGYEQIFKSLESHFLRANRRDVEDALEIMKERNTGGLGVITKDRRIFLKQAMPSFIYFNPRLSRKINFNEIQKDKKEMKNFWEGWLRFANKFRVKLPKKYI